MFYACPNLYDKHYRYIFYTCPILLKASYRLLSFLSGREAAVAALIQSQEDKTDDQRPEAHIGPRR